MPICKKCGLILAANDTVCRGCGTPVPKAEQPAQQPLFQSSAMPESAPLPKLSGLNYSSPLSSSAQPSSYGTTGTTGTSATPPPPPSFSAPPPLPQTPPPTPSFTAPPPMPSSQPPATPSFTPPPIPSSQPPATPSFSAPPPIPSTPSATPPTPPPSTPAEPTFTPPPAPTVAAATQPPSTQPKAPTPAEQTQDEPPQPPRPKPFKPNSGSKLPPNLNIDNQPVAGVRQPFQQRQQQPAAQQYPPPSGQRPIMAQPPHGYQQPPMAQPLQGDYQPPQNFNSGLLLACLALIPCCGFNIFAIIAIVLSAIAGGEYKRGDYDMAMKHAKISKSLTIIAIVSAIIIWIFILMPISIETQDHSVLDQPQSTIQFDDD